MEIRSTRLLVVGGGTGGYVAAIRAAQLGVSTILVEGNHLGGTCLNIGCIPSKALIHVADEFEAAKRFAREGAFGIRAGAPLLDVAEAMKWKDGVVKRLTGGVASLLRKAGAQVVEGWATILDGKTVEVARGADVLRVECEHLLLAPGSVPLALPALPFGGRVVSSTEALSPDAIPRRLAVVGAGYIGLELGTAFRKMGSEVTVIEALDRVLPLYDAELTRPLDASLRRLGVALRLGCRVLGASDAGDAVRVQDENGAESEIAADRVLVAIGRKPRTEGWGLEKLRLDMQGRFVRVDDQCRTSMRNVWAVGDVTGEPMLAHRATAQGEMVAEIVAGHRRRFDPAVIPAVCYTDPEVVAVGRAPGDDGDVVSAQFPFAANGRALTLDAHEGFVRVVARREDHLIVGWQAVGRGVSELAAAFAQSIEMGARLEDVAGTIHAHPTLGEAAQEAALRALGRPLHV